MTVSIASSRLLRIRDVRRSNHRVQSKGSALDLKRNPVLLAATIGLAGALTACGGPPGESDIQRALEKNTAATIAAGEELQGKAWAEKARQEAKVFSVRLTGACVEEGKKKYRCPIEVDWSNALAPRHTETMSPLVYRGAGGWTLPVEGDDRFRSP